jgi:hypothetical protein
MPVARAVNGGWRRVSTEQLRQEESVVIQQERAAARQCIRAGGSTHVHSKKQHTQQQDNDGVNGNNNNNGNINGDDNDVYNDWASEGIRRVRLEKVTRKMHHLTAIAAIGGFLFGYDTASICYCCLFLFFVCFPV